MWTSHNVGGEEGSWKASDEAGTCQATQGCFDKYPLQMNLIIICLTAEISRHLLPSCPQLPRSVSYGEASRSGPVPAAVASAIHKSHSLRLSSVTDRDNTTCSWGVVGKKDHEMDRVALRKMADQGTPADAPCDNHPSAVPPQFPFYFFKVEQKWSSILLAKELPFPFFSRREEGRTRFLTR